MCSPIKISICSTIAASFFSNIDEPLYSCGLLESGDDVVGVLGGDWRDSPVKLREPPRFRAVAVSGTSSPHTIRGRCYCVKNLYATISATMLAKISSAGKDFRIIGLWRAADRPG